MLVCERCGTQLDPGVKCGEYQSVCELCGVVWIERIATDATLNFSAEHPEAWGRWNELIAEDATDLADRLGFSNHSE